MTNIIDINGDKINVGDEVTVIDNKFSKQSHKRYRYNIGPSPITWKKVIVKSRPFELTINTSHRKTDTLRCDYIQVMDKENGKFYDVLLESIVKNYGII